jgi:hypothetical protein
MLTWRKAQIRADLFRGAVTGNVPVIPCRFEDSEFEGNSLQKIRLCKQFNSSRLRE